MKKIMSDKLKEVDAETFKKAIEAVREKGDIYKANIHPYSLDEYKDMKTYMTPDSKSGYAIKPNGELVNVHSTVKGRGDSLVKDAVERGATKLDAFDIKGKLPTLYGRHGFRETGRFDFDPQYAEDLELLKQEKPDFVTMERKPQSARELTRQKEKLAKMKYLKELKGEVSPEVSKQLDTKLQQINNSIRERAALEANQTQKIKGITEHIDTKSRLPIKSGDEFTESVAKKRLLNKLSKGAGRFAKAGLKSLPLVGGIAAAIQSNDASAAVPLLDQADSLGPGKGTPSSIIEDPTVSPEERKRAIELLRKQGER